jgi:hypothetical protein
VDNGDRPKTKYDNVVLVNAGSRAELNLALFISLY